MNRAKAWLVVFLSSAFLLVGQAEARHPKHSSSSQETATQQGTAGQFDYYLLTLSWSPTYCLTHPGDTKQCGNKGLGFVLHGLWPQYNSGGYPQNCPTQYQLTPEAIAFGDTIFPNSNLISHEWSKHGTCSGLDALGYFQAADQARTSVKVPEAFDAPKTTFTTTAKDIAAQFTAANPNFPEHAVVASCSGPELAEVRICLDKDLNPQACGTSVKSNCGQRSVRVPSVH